MSHEDAEIRTALEAIFKNDSRRIFATLVGMFGDFDLAQEVLQDAFTVAFHRWPKDGIPKNPKAWLVSTARFKAIDILRRQARFDQTIAKHIDTLAPGTTEIDDYDEQTFKDDHLKLIFTCCHPALAPNAQIALTLREICALSTEQIASAFLVSPATIAQRIVRAKAKIRQAKIPFQIPSIDTLSERLESVLTVIYLVFNEGYSSSSGDRAIRTELSNKAIHLGETLLELLEDAEIMGLLAMMHLHESRREARLDKNGDLILLEDQDRSLWNTEHINRGNELIARAFTFPQIGIYTIQAAISAAHAKARTAAETNWQEIVTLYDLMLQAEPNPVVALNRAVAVAMRDGPEAGLKLIDALLADGHLTDYHLAHAARADLNRRLHKADEARAAYQQALALANQEPERRFLAKRLQELA